MENCPWSVVRGQLQSNDTSDYQKGTTGNRQKVLRKVFDFGHSRLAFEHSSACPFDPFARLSSIYEQLEGKHRVAFAVQLHIWMYFSASSFVLNKYYV